MFLTFHIHNAIRRFLLVAYQIFKVELGTLNFFLFNIISYVMCMFVCNIHLILPLHLRN